MKRIKMFSLAAMAALMVMALVGASSAMAGNTALCKADENPCAKANLVTHVHETTLSGAKAVILTEPEIKCDVLFLSSSVGKLGAPQIIKGNYTYSNCEPCTVEEQNGPAELKVLRTGFELASVTLKLLLHLECTFGFDCYLIGLDLQGHGLGPLGGSSETNGAVTFSNQLLDPEPGGGFFCPEDPFLDIQTTPLSATYISE